LTLRLLPSQTTPSTALVGFDDLLVPRSGPHLEGRMQRRRSAAATRSRELGRALAAGTRASAVGPTLPLGASSEEGIQPAFRSSVASTAALEHADCGARRDRWSRPAVVAAVAGVGGASGPHVLRIAALASPAGQAREGLPSPLRTPRPRNGRAAPRSDARTAAPPPPSLLRRRAKTESVGTTLSELTRVPSAPNPVLFAGPDPPSSGSPGTTVARDREARGEVRAERSGWLVAQFRRQSRLGGGFRRREQRMLRRRRPQDRRPLSARACRSVCSKVDAPGPRALCTVKTIRLLFVGGGGRACSSLSRRKECEFGDRTVAAVCDVLRRVRHRLRQLAGHGRAESRPYTKGPHSLQTEGNEERPLGTEAPNMHRYFFQDDTKTSVLCPTCKRATKLSEGVSKLSSKKAMSSLQGVLPRR